MFLFAVFVEFWLVFYGPTGSCFIRMENIIGMKYSI